MKWISVKERLPGVDTPVMLLMDCNFKSPKWRMAFGELENRGSGRWWAIEDKGLATFECVTHWMPMPDLPEDKS